MTIGIIAKITIQEGKTEEAIAAFQPMLAAVDDEESTIRYILHTDASNPNLLWFYEQYADQASLDAHGTSDTMKAVGLALRGIAAARPEITVLDVVGGKTSNRIARLSMGGFACAAPLAAAGKPA